MQQYNVIGLMSGTSLDGVDLALCVFRESRDGWSYKITHATTVPYNNGWKRKLSTIHRSKADEFAAFHVEYGSFLGTLVRDFLKKNKMKADFVSSHGHTIFHQPGKKFTTQIGEGAALGVACGLPVVSDFRTVDVALGGQGAPLVPAGDKLLFGEYAYCLNLGGISNISFDKKLKRVAFDICPVNTVLNLLAAMKGKNYDKDGRLASKGKIDDRLLARLNSISYYRKSYPKSLGREDIEREFFPLLIKNRSSAEDKLRTFCEHIAIQIGAVLKSTGSTREKMILTGGGALNSFLVKRINNYSNARVIVPDKLIVEFKEALIFAFLGVLRWRNEVNCMSSVTGASRDSVGGCIYNSISNIIRPGESKKYPSR